MDRTELKHYGVLGMKWGVRRYQNPDGTLTPAGRRRVAKVEAREAKKAAAKAKPKPINRNPRRVKNMTDDEIHAAIARIELERRYKTLLMEKGPNHSGGNGSQKNNQVSKGESMASKVLKRSGENIATQLTTYAMGAAVNGIANKVGSKLSESESDTVKAQRIKDIFTDVVNPKKGQKDK